MLPKLDDLPPTHAEGPLDIRAQGMLDVTDVCKSNFRVPSARLYEDALDLAKVPQGGTDVGLERAWPHFGGITGSVIGAAGVDLHV